MKWIPAIVCLVCLLIVVDISITHQNPIQQIDCYLVNSEYSTLEIDDRFLNSKADGGSFHIFTSRYHNQCEREFLRTHDDLDADSIDYCKKNPERYAPIHWKYEVALPDDNLTF